MLLLSHIGIPGRLLPWSCLTQTKSCPTDVRIHPTHTEGSSLLPLVWGWMASSSFPSKFLTCSRGGTRATTSVARCTRSGSRVRQCLPMSPVLIPPDTLPCLSAAGGSSACVDDSQLVPEDAASRSSPPVFLCRPSHPLS